MALKTGDQAPDFHLPDQDGNTVSLGDFEGRRLLLYFYPKDETPGCTIEACEFRDAREQYAERGIAVVGVSADDGASHRRFRANHGLEFPLLSDVDGTVSKAYDSWGTRTYSMGEFTGVFRSTFLIDEQGRIAEAWYNVSPQGHPEAVLAAI
jgi:peroxiredoxin Q/BCP